MGSSAGLAALPAAIRHMEQRLETERRHADRQTQRLERRIEEVACASAAGGRWAELQGYVDGLAETVQGLVRAADDGSRGAQRSVQPAGTVALPQGVLDELRENARAGSARV